MGTFLTDKCNEIRNWLAIGSDVYPDPVVTGWIRMAEEYLSTVLRVKHMIQIDTSTLIKDRVPLPLDWQEVRLVRRLDTDGVCRYQTPDAFFNPEFPDGPEPPYNTRNSRYCILGNYLFVGEVTSSPGLEVELTYYQNIPPLTDDVNNWPNCFHPTVYTLKILHIASLYAIEDERGVTWDNEVSRAVNTMNAAHKVDMASGSVLMQVRKKTFG
jgi:hypothetical protein